MTNPRQLTFAGVFACFVFAIMANGLSVVSGASTPGSESGSGLYGRAAILKGRITAGHVIEPLSGLHSNLPAHGYIEQEFFASGNAQAFRATSSPKSGRWSITPTTSAPYRTRILVRRPRDPARFNGTVVVEWMNVSGGESAPDWDYLNPELMRAGYAYVGVSAQALGVDGGTPILGSLNAGSSGGLVHEEPQRYGTLQHPGDQYALDMFAQIGTAVRGNDDDLLGGLRPRRVVAVGESQSAFYLTTFADAFQPLTHSYDGIFIHSRGGGGASLTGPAITSAVGPDGLWIRTDLQVPVFMFETQTDLVELGYAAARQPNTGRIRTWEVAGTSHADAYLVGSAAKTLGCTSPINDGPQHPVVQAAFAAFNRWVASGTQPPSPKPFGLAGTNPVRLALDSHGNVIGGVRTPAVDAPVSTLSGTAPPGTSVVCSLFGSTNEFNSSTLKQLYGSKKQFLREYTTSLNKAIAGKFILPFDRAALLAQAEKVQFPT